MKNGKKMKAGFVGRHPIKLGIGLILTFVVVLVVSNSFKSKVLPEPARSPELVNPTAIERGRYLATAGNCMTCHTVEGGDAYAGGLPFHTDFGVIYSTNITPDPEKGIGNWTEEHFSRAMRKGISADGSHLYPAFPYPSFSNITDDDLQDLFAYLLSMSPSSSEPPKNEMSFPFNQRWLMWFWNRMYLKGGPFEADSSKSDEWNRGAYLVEGLAHCGTCHSPRDGNGGIKRKERLSGGVYNDKVDGDKIRAWSAVNLTPSRDGLASWNKQDLIDYLQTGFSVKAGTFGPMNEVIINSTSKLAKSDVAAMAEYLKTVAPIQRSSNYQMEPSEFSSADILYTIHCGTCHLPTGLGDARTAPALVGSAIVQAEDPSSLINILLYGADKPSSGLQETWSKAMKPFGDKLSDDEIAQIATYIRSNWDNLGGKVTEEDVRKQR